jgi:hypothetical protein
MLFSKKYSLYTVKNGGQVGWTPTNHFSHYAHPIDSPAIKQNNLPPSRNLQRILSYFVLYVCVCVCVCVCACMCVCVCMCVYMCVHVCVYMCVSVYCVSAYVCTFVCVCVCMYSSRE